MCITDSIGDLLSRIRNGQHARKKVVNSPCSREKIDILKVLQSEGYIRSFDVESDTDGVKQLKIELKYLDGMPVIRIIDRVSSPGRRVYSGIKDMPVVYNGLGINVVSTSKGIMSDVQARKNAVGGEIICRVF
jgi:small subunit ribosomal protein S8